MRDAVIVEGMLKDRLDEFLLLEQKIGKHCEKMVGLRKEYNELSEQTLLEMRAETRSISGAALDFKALLNTMNEKFDKRMFMGLCVFLGALALSAILILGSIFYAHHVNGELESAKFKLVYLESKISKTPRIIEYAGRHYVRVEPDTGRWLSGDEGKEKGAFYELWLGDK